MAPKSTIRRLPPKLRKALDDLLAGDRHTIDEIVAHLAELGAGVSRSAVGRYKQTFDRVAARMRQSREMANALIAEIGPAAQEGKTGRLLAEMLQGIVFDHLMVHAGDDEDEDAGATPQDLARLAKTLKDLASATKIDVDREQRVREMVATEAATAAKSGAKQAGLTDETAQVIYDQVLGVRKKAA